VLPSVFYYVVGVPRIHMTLRGRPKRGHGARDVSADCLARGARVAADGCPAADSAEPA